jgi:hypothetical protein
LPIAVSNSVLGITPASLFLSAFTITMNRIVSLRWVQIPVTGFGRPPNPGSMDMTNRVLRHRHAGRNYFGSNCGRDPTAMPHPSIVNSPIDRGPEIAEGTRRFR